MDTVNRNANPFLIRFQRWVVSVWTGLRHPMLAPSLIALLALIFLLRLLIPQQNSADISMAAWVTTLPAWLQPWGELLFFLGFSRILHSFWFWLPVALLLLHSLVALAEYAPPSWQRIKEEIPDLSWQHPLAYRAEQSVRLPPVPYVLLDSLKETLAGQGFSIQEPEADHERLALASRWQWAWSGVLLFYSGLVLLCFAFLVSRYSLGVEWLTLLPAEPERSNLLDGSFELVEVGAGQSLVTVSYTPAGANSAQTLTWRRNWPALLGDAIVLPVAVDPVLSVEARDESGQLRRLMPVQAELGPDTRLNFTLDEPGAAFYFLIPSASLAFQIAPVQPSTGDQTYNVQVLHGSEQSPSENLMIRQGETFEVDDLSIRLFLNHDLSFIAYHDWALPLYSLSLLAIAGGLLALLLRPPWLVWLMPEIKGRGGQLYGVVEWFGPGKPGRSEKGPQFLTQLLNQNHLLEEAEET